jgi:hypothetical protein
MKWFANLEGFRVFAFPLWFSDGKRGSILQGLTFKYGVENTVKNKTMTTTTLQNHSPTSSLICLFASSDH